MKAQGIIPPPKLEDTTIEDVLKTFQDSYAQKDFAKAQSILQSHRQDVEPELWHYNMGTVKAQLKSWAEARFHFLEAQAHGLTGAEANLRIVEKNLEVQRLEKPLSVQDYFVQLSLGATNLGATTFVSLVILIVGLWHLRRRWSLGLGALYGVLLSLPLIFGLWVSQWPKGVALESATLLEGPSVIFGTRAELPAGVLVVFRQEGEWKEVIYPSRFRGWIKSSNLKMMELAR